MDHPLDRQNHILKDFIRNPPVIHAFFSTVAPPGWAHGDEEQILRRSGKIQADARGSPAQVFVTFAAPHDWVPISFVMPVPLPGTEPSALDSG